MPGVRIDQQDYREDASTAPTWTIDDDEKKLPAPQSNQALDFAIIQHIQQMQQMALMQQMKWRQTNAMMLHAHELCVANDLEKEDVCVSINSAKSQASHDRRAWDSYLQMSTGRSAA